MMAKSSYLSDNGDHNGPHLTSQGRCSLGRKCAKFSGSVCELLVLVRAGASTAQKFFACFAKSAKGWATRREPTLLLGWFPKLDRIAIRIFKPRKDPHGGIFLGLFDCHAFALQMAEDFFHVFHRVINLARSWLILDVLIRGHNRPRYRSLDLRVCKIPVFERCIDGTALSIFALRDYSEAIAISGRQAICIVGKQKNAANSVDHEFPPTPHLRRFPNRQA